MVAELVKGIKPKKLNVDKIRQEILDQLRLEGAAIKKEFDKTIVTWQGAKPKFEVLIGLTGKDATVVVGPTGSNKAVLKWIWIDEGTKPHKIKAKNIPKPKPGKRVRTKPMLIFREGFSPKTLPGKLASFPSGSFGPWVSKEEVQHPGTEPRNFTKLAVRRRRKKFINNITKATTRI